ncbi:MAG: TonB-dependent receptor, partial [Bryobacterales bacterium]|nr:TonB-dependent receptor [Bryobacterales bacterium]
WSVNQQLFKGILMFGGLSGTAFSDLIQGIPLGLMRQVTFSTPMYNNKEYALHIQDDWRATRWLTLNVGLRYDIFTPTTERHNRLSNFDPTDAAMLASGKIQMAGVNGISATNGIATQYNNFQPRLGFAATAGRGFVVRGGFGTTYYPDTQANPGYQKNAPLTSTYFGPTTMSQAPPIQPDSDCLVASCGNNTPGTAVAAAMVKNLKWPIVYMTNLMFEKSFGDNLITAGYVGQFTRNGPYVFSNANQPLPPLEKGGCGTVVDVRSLPDPCQPYYKSIPNVSVIQLLTDKGFSNYNAFQVEFRRNLQKGLMINTNYTLTNNLSNGGSQRSSCGGGCQNTLDDVSRDYGPDDIMVKHRYVMMASYMLPFGNNLKGIAGVLGKGWQMNGIYIYSSGLPFNVTDGLDTQNTAVGANQGTERMDVVPSSGFTQSINQWFDTSQFRRQTKGTFGNLGMNAFTGPASKKLDMSLFKEFRVKESVAAQFRAEIFNLTNTPSFGGPSFSIPGYSADGKPSFAGSTFGMITATNSMATPRQIQFAVKLVF